jgi:hypothetical protein
VAVIRVGRLESLHQRLVPGDQDVADGAVHEVSEAGKPSGWDVGAVLAERCEHLIKDVIG